MQRFNTAVPLVKLTALSHDNVIAITHEDIHLLIIVKGLDIYVIEDRCGHFGVSLKTGEIDNGAIRCPVHGAKFDLTSGELCNGIFEDCDPINVFQWRKHNGWLEVLM